MSVHIACSQIKKNEIHNLYIIRKEMFYPNVYEAHTCSTIAHNT